MGNFNVGERISKRLCKSADRQDVFLQLIVFVSKMESVLKEMQDGPCRVIFVLIIELTKYGNDIIGFVFVRCRGIVPDL